MKLGVALPIVDIGGETAVVREFAQAARRSGITGSRHPTTCWAPISRAGPAGAPRSRHQACLPRGVPAAALSGPPGQFLRMEENRGRQAALCDCAEGSATDAHGRVMGNLALAGGREDPQLHHHRHQAEQIVRRASQPARASVGHRSAIFSAPRLRKSGSHETRRWRDSNPRSPG